MILLVKVFILLVDMISAVIQRRKISTWSCIGERSISPSNLIIFRFFGSSQSSNKGFKNICTLFILEKNSKLDNVVTILFGTKSFDFSFQQFNFMIDIHSVRQSKS